MPVFAAQNIGKVVQVERMGMFRAMKYHLSGRSTGSATDIWSTELRIVKLQHQRLENRCLRTRPVAVRVDLGKRGGGLMS